MSHALARGLMTGTPDAVEAQLDAILELLKTVPTPSVRAEKLRTIDSKVAEWVAAGRDTGAIEPLVRELAQLQESGRADRVEAQADRILAVVDSEPTPPSRSENRFSGLQEQIDDWLASGGNPAEVLPLGKQLDELLAAGDDNAVDELVEKIRATVSRPPEGPLPTQDATPTMVDVRPIPPQASIVFYSVRSGLGPEVYTMDADGSEVTQITFLNPRPYDQPYEHVAVSFDRTLIAANRYLRGGSGPTGVWVIDLKHKTERRLFPEFFTTGHGGVDWSEDGLLYFAARRSPREKEGVFRCRPDGSGLERLIALEPDDRGHVGDVSVSEDSSMIAYIRAISVDVGYRTLLKTQVWVAGSDGSRPRMVDDGGPVLGNQGGFPVGDFDPELSPDNEYVVFSRTNTDHINFKESFDTAHDLWVARVDGSEPARRITQPGPISVVPDWHDGRIVYTYYSQAAGDTGLMSINPDGSDLRRLETERRGMRNAALHGKWIPASRSRGTVVDSEPTAQ